MTPAAGVRLGPYEIISPIGAGGMGEVWRAKDTRLGREVALKFLPADFAADPERHARFEREAKVLASLNHPHIAVLYGLEHLDGQHALAMELVEGEGLDERIARGRIPVDDVLAIAGQIAEALEAAHEKGIVHRDLKPANVRVRPDGTVKVLDFGLAKAWESEGTDGGLTHSPTITSHNTRAGVILGTAAYMAPEQARGKAVDKRADIWAFGCLVYEMLTGGQAFTGETVTDVLASVVKSAPDWSALPAEVPKRSREVLQRCLEKDPRRRFRDIGDVRLDLEESLLHDTVETAAPPPELTSVRRSARPSWLPWSFVALSLAVAVGVSILVGVGRGKEHLTAGPVFEPMSFRPQTIFAARFAPDGRTVVYSAALAGNEPELFVVTQEYPESRPLGLHDTHLLAVSPSGELAVLTGARYVGHHRIFIGTLGRARIEGGAPRQVLDGVREADWTPDGSGLAIIREMGGKDRLEYPIGTVLHEAPGYLSDLRFSPTGKAIAFFEHPMKWDDRGSVMLVSLGGKATKLAGGYAALEGLAWSTDGREVLFSANKGHELSTVYGVTSAGVLRKVLPSAGDLTIHDLSRDGRWLVTRDDDQRGICALTPGAAGEKDLSWLDSSMSAHLSEDGRLLVFSETGEVSGPTYSLCLRQTDGSPVVHLGSGASAGLSPDGKWALAMVQETPERLVLYPTGAGEPRQLDRGAMENYSSAQWFPDGKKVLSCGNQPDHASRCYVQDIGGGPPRPLTPEGTSEGVVSPDGTLIAARDAGRGFSIYPLDGGAARPVPWVEPDETVISWSADSRALLVSHLAGIPARVERLDLATGRRELFREIAPRDRTGVLSLLDMWVSEDARSYAYTYYRRVSRLFLVEGMR